MNTRYKIFLIITCFVLFYFAIFPIYQYCVESGYDCSLYREIVTLTRPTISSDTLGNGISNRSGTAEGIESPTMAVQIMRNMPFVVSMIVLPFVSIGLVVVWDKRK